MLKFQEIFSILLFNQCSCCGKYFETYCDDCAFKTLDILPTCFICEKLSNNFVSHSVCFNNKPNLYPTQSIYLVEYLDKIKDIINGYKRFGANRYIINKLVDIGLNQLQLINYPDLIVIVPSNRGFFSKNIESTIQEIMVSKIKKKYGVSKVYRPFDIDIFMPSQKQLNLETRYQNIRNKISLNDKFDIQLLNDKNILVIDDILTSGATLSWVIKLLSESKFKSLSSLHFARELIV